MDLAADPSLPDRFWAKVDKTGDCWIWTAATVGKGYGAIYFCQRLQLAHRVSVFLDSGAWPTGKVVMHSCDNPPCVRPDHLSVGTQKQNLADMRAKGRMSLGQAKITREQAEEIRAAHAAGASRSDLARQYGVVPTHVTAIVARRAWK